MPPTCTVCSHEKRKEIDRDLVMGKSVRHVASRYRDFSYGAAQRHRTCIADAIASAELSSAFTARSVMLGLVKELRTIATECLTSGMKRDFLLVADRLTRACESFGKLNREMPSPTVEAFVLSLGVTELDVRSALDMAKAGERVNLEDLYAEWIETGRFLLTERPELREPALMALGTDRISEASVIEANGSGS